MRSGILLSEMPKKTIKKPGVRHKVGPKKAGAGYDMETTYQYFRAAGGAVDAAIRLAVEAEDKRVPRDRNTWFVRAKEEGWRQRYQKETTEEWKNFHSEREAKKQHMLDRMAHAIEPLIERYADILGQAILAWTYVEDAEWAKEHPVQARKKRLELEHMRNRFTLGPEVFDRLCRLYMRSMGMPEKITFNTHEIRNPTVLTYEDAEAQKSMSKTGQIIRPMVAKDLQEARNLMETIDLGSEWDIAEGESMA